MVNLSGKVALVTGGSVGKDLALGFLDAGADTAFIYRNPERASELRREFDRFSGVFQAVQCDLADATQAVRAVSSVKERFGGVDFLLNSLGGWLGGKKLHEHTATEFERMISMDLIPTFNIMAAVLPVMSEQRFGRIVNFISMHVFGAGAGNSVYAASKSAILALSRATAEEYKDLGITVHTVAPGTIDTPNNRKAMPNADRQRWVQTSEIVEALLFLCGAGGSLNDTVLKFPGK